MEPTEKLVRTVCHTGCGMACGLLAHVKDGVLTKIEPAEFPNPRSPVPLLLIISTTFRVDVVKRSPQYTNDLRPAALLASFIV